MKKYIMKDTTTKYETSKVGTVLNIFAIIGIVRGIIAGFVFAMNVPGEDGFVILTAIAVWPVSILSGLMLMAIAEIIDILRQILYHTISYQIEEKERALCRPENLAVFISWRATSSRKYTSF